MYKKSKVKITLSTTENGKTFVDLQTADKYLVFFSLDFIVDEVTLQDKRKQ